MVLDEDSDGLLLGFYNGTVTKAECTAGVRVVGIAGSYSLVAVVNGAEQAVSYELASGHTYAIRVRTHCAEMQRARQRYGVLVDGVFQQFGGGSVNASIQVVIEVVDEGLASNTLPTVLYDGGMSDSPLECVFAPVNSVSLNGSIARVTLKQTGSCWAVTTANDGSRKTLREGATGTGADFTASTTGVLSFAAGVVPQPGELLTVQYRGSGRAYSRRTDDAAEFVKDSLGLPGVPSWTGHVTSPKARSSADCDAAAKALLALSSGSATGVSGSITWKRGAELMDDVQPNNLLLVTSGEGTRVMPVQGVSLVDGSTWPEQVEYTATFRQNRSVSMNFKVANSLASDLPDAVAVTTDGIRPANLSGLQVTSATESELEIDCGVDVPDGYGVEVRRSDANFGSANTDDLVLRSEVRNFSIPRLAYAERYFMRMYNSSETPVYAAVSSVVFTSLPLS